MQRTTLRQTTPRTNAPEPRWPVVVALLGAAAVYLAMPEAMSLGPRWLLVVIIVVLLVPSFVTHHLGHVRVNVWLGYLLSGVLTAALLGSLALLIAGVVLIRE